MRSELRPARDARRSHAPGSSEATGSAHSVGGDHHSGASLSGLASRPAAGTTSDPTRSAPAAATAPPPPTAAGVSGAPATAAHAADDGREKRRKRVAAQLKDLQQCYLALRSQQRQLELDMVPGLSGCLSEAAVAAAEVR